MNAPSRLKPMLMLVLGASLLVLHQAAYAADAGGGGVKPAMVCMDCGTTAPPPAQPVTITRYVITDRLGNPVAKTNSVGAVIWRQTYTPYGETAQQPDPDGPGFTGHRHDAATGLVYMQARYYDPKIGQFLSPDPVTFSSNQPQHFNLYWYGNGNPYKYVDPDGRTIHLVNPSDKGAVEHMINSLASGKFKFDKKGNLQRTSSKGAPNHSTYYSKRLNQAIQSSGTIKISVKQFYKDPYTGFMRPVDGPSPGGGVTIGNQGKDQKVVVSGHAGSVTGISGQPIPSSAADTLAHELVGHAIPHVVGPDTGNAVDNMNKVRAQTGEPLRQEDPTHVE